MSDKTVAPPVGYGTRVRKSPYFAATQRHGAKSYTVYNHMYMPLYYEDPVTDYWTLVRDVAVWDVACERQVEITGPDAAHFTQRLTPRNLSQCEIGQAKYVFITNPEGGIINDPVLMRLGENHFWLSLADSDVLLWAQGLAHAWGLNVTLGEPDVSPLQVQGPKSPSVIKDLFGDWILSLRYYRFRETELDGIPLILARTGWSNERGYELFLRDGRRGEELWERVMAAGRPYGIAPGGPSTIKRIEAGLLSYGTDMTAAENPYEIGWGRFVDVEQSADFVGKAGLRRIKDEGVQRLLVGLVIDADPLPGNEAHWPVLGEDGRVGHVTSAVHSPRLAQNIALAMVDIAHTEPGTSLRVATPQGTFPAQVAAVPFVDPMQR